MTFMQVCSTKKIMTAEGKREEELKKSFLQNPRKPDTLDFAKFQKFQMIYNFIILIRQTNHAEPYNLLATFNYHFMI